MGLTESEFQRIWRRLISRDLPAAYWVIEERATTGLSCQEMTKQQLIEQVMGDSGETRTVVARLYDAIFARMSDALQTGEKIDVRGFEVFEAKQTKARTGRNPSTGETIDIPSRRKATFRPSKELKQRLATAQETVAATQNV